MLFRFVQACAHERACFSLTHPPPWQDVQADGHEICISSSAGDLFDLSTHNTSGGLSAENLGSNLISQGGGERKRETCRDGVGVSVRVSGGE